VNSYGVGKNPAELLLALARNLAVVNSYGVGKNPAELLLALARNLAEVRGQ